MLGQIKFQRLKRFRWRKATVISLNGFSLESSGPWGDDMGIILKENSKVGDAERMCIQARFFAPEKAKALVDRYSRQ
ncbi:hypothetical protein ACB098_05G220100 [Castanea mollissima]|uniref:Uncharacterized protein n=1 Tax=Castanea mollissima TaxID=60419 RepID=A0A8J4VRP8_9ROSI|nr:hypothetical protein CMV_008816 [Castanea mollissima]